MSLSKVIDNVFTAIQSNKKKKLASMTKKEQGEGVLNWPLLLCIPKINWSWQPILVLFWSLFDPKIVRFQSQYHLWGSADPIVSKKYQNFVFLKSKI